MKTKTQFVCQQCGAAFAKWQGQCNRCEAWNSLVEEVVEVDSKKRSRTKASLAVLDKKLISFSQVKAQKGVKKRFSTGIGELDRVLGGGLVPGAMVLIGGEPGVGKSTLLTQMVLQMLKMGEQTSGVLDQIFYVCGEESPNQISLRINRMTKNEQQNLDKLYFISSTDVDEINSLIIQHKPDLVIVDSIQTLVTSDLTGASGSIGQVRECTDRLIKTTKPLHIPVLLVGHVTKDGTISGPKTLEHMVDSVLQLEGERTGNLRVLRALKNRFGATDEVGLFRVVSYGMEEVVNPSKFFLEEQNKGIAGSAIVGVLEGTRPLLIEVQALVVKSQLAMPRRVGRGIELSRIQILSALLQKHCKLPLGSYDIFLSAAGGFKIKEPAVDLGLAMAIYSSLKNKPLPQNTVYIGEVGLLGEIRSVPYLDQRIKEVKRLGFKNIFSRKNNKNIRELVGSK